MELILPKPCIAFRSWRSCSELFVHASIRLGWKRADGERDRLCRDIPVDEFSTTTTSTYLLASSRTKLELLSLYGQSVRSGLRLDERQHAGDQAPAIMQP